jgi:hypothetical protein
MPQLAVLGADPFVRQSHLQESVGGQVRIEVFWSGSANLLRDKNSITAWANLTKAPPLV